MECEKIELVFVKELRKNRQTRSEEKGQLRAKLAELNGWKKKVDQMCGERRRIREK
jgi:hypothetical protein